MAVDVSFVVLTFMTHFVSAAVMSRSMHQQRLNQAAGRAGLSRPRRHPGWKGRGRRRTPLLINTWRQLKFMKVGYDAEAEGEFRTATRLDPSTTVL